MLVVTSILFRFYSSPVSMKTFLVQIYISNLMQKGNINNTTCDFPFPICSTRTEDQSPCSCLNVSLWSLAEATGAEGSYHIQMSFH